MIPEHESQLLKTFDEAAMKFERAWSEVDEFVKSSKEKLAQEELQLERKRRDLEIKEMMLMEKESLLRKEQKALFPHLQKEIPNDEVIELNVGTIF